MSEPAREKTPKRKFPKDRRLLRHADFEKVYKEGRRHFAAHMTIFYLRRDDGGQTGGLRVGFTVGKVLGGAVQRNRMKRRLREAVRLSGFGEAVGVDVVINPKRSLLSADFVDVHHEIGQAFKVIEKHVSSRKVTASKTIV